MSIVSANMRGIGFMVLATGCFVTNDTFIKAMTGDLPALELMFFRSLLSIVWCIPLIIVTGTGRAVPALRDKWVTLRNLGEVVTVLFFVYALIHLPLATISAVGQLAPMIVLVAAAILFKERLSALQGVLIVIAFAGALMVVQPTGAGFSPYAFLGLGIAAGTALRDLVARNVPAHVPGPVVALGAGLAVAAITLPVGLTFEQWAWPDPSQLLLFAGAGLFLTFGHLCIFMAYRVAPVGVVAPFLYTFTIWAVILGFLAFGDLPNALGFVGIAVIMTCGVSIVLLSGRQRRIGVGA